MGNYKDAIKKAQKAVLCYPNVPETWTVLISSLVLKRSTLNVKISELDLNVLIDFVISDLSPSAVLVEWLKQQKMSLNTI